MKLILILIFSVFTLVVKSQSIIWTDFKNLNDSLRKEQKPLMIFIYTDWCKYCKMQEETTFKNPSITSQLNSKYYCLMLNAEYQYDIDFLNRRYKKRASGYHELAENIGKEKWNLTFPTTVFFDKNLVLKKREHGLLDKMALSKYIEN